MYKFGPVSFGNGINFPILRTVDQVFSTVYSRYYNFIQTLNFSEKE